MFTTLRMFIGRQGGRVRKLLIMATWLCVMLAMLCSEKKKKKKRKIKAAISNEWALAVGCGAIEGLL